MCKTVLNCYVDTADYSRINSLSKTNSNGYDRYIDKPFRNNIFTDSCEGYDTDYLVSRCTEWMKKDGISKYLQENARFSVAIELILVASHLDGESVPGLTLSKHFLRTAASINAHLEIVLDVLSSNNDDDLTSGAYYYIIPQSGGVALDIHSINHAAGITSSTVPYVKGSTDIWAIECGAEKSLPDIPIGVLMDIILTPKSLASYSKTNKLLSHIDVTCYGVPNKIIKFQVTKEFISFCQKANIQYCDIDIR